MRARASAGGGRWIPALALGVACGAQAAAPGSDPIAWLQRAAEAARSSSYAGTFAHSNGDRTSTVRITHVNASGEAAILWFRYTRNQSFIGWCWLC